MLGFRECEIRAVSLWSRSDFGALARQPDGADLRRSSGAAPDTEGAEEGAQRDPVLLRLSDRRVLPVGRRLVWPSLCGNAAVGRAAGHACPVLCWHRRVAAAGD